MATTLTDTNPIDLELVERATKRGEQMLSEVIARHKRLGQYTTGKTSSTLRIVPKTDGFEVVGWKYAGTFDEGRRAGGMPPVSAILEWINAKGLTFDKPNSAEHYAFAIARTIAKRGTRRYHHNEDVWETPVRDMTTDIADMTTKYLAFAVARELKRIDIGIE